MTKTLTSYILELLQDPKNREIVNEGQDWFEVDYDFSEKGLYFTFSEKDNDFSESFHYNLWELLPEFAQIAVAKWCIKLFPAFQEENPKFKKLENAIKQNQLLCNNIQTGQVIVAESYLLAGYLPAAKTLSEALLKSGAMTVDELEEEWRNLKKVG